MRRWQCDFICNTALQAAPTNGFKGGAIAGATGTNYVATTPGIINAE
ncbi:MAG: hypothetical protein IPO03_15925 [Bacteroidetes bacterium]|nr:hypothetical protein [Bacteroidota bacterium]